MSDPLPQDDATSKPWFDPDVLSANERRTAAADLNQIRKQGGGFSSYALLNREGVAPPQLGAHSLIRGRERAEMYRHLLRGRRITAVADLGCGVGITTQALAEVFPAAEIFGYDVSSEGISAASRHFSGPTYQAVALRPETELGRTFDLVLAQEFYPFTRTSEWDFHQSYLSMIDRHVAPGGLVLIVLSEREQGTLLRCIPRLEEFCRGRHYGLTSRRLPSDRIFSVIPYYPAARLLTAFLPNYHFNRCIMLEKS